MKSFFKILFLLLIAASYTIIRAAEDTNGDAEEEEESNFDRDSQEIVTFINFSDRPIEVYFVDTSTPERKKYLAATAVPYNPVQTKTFTGHLFVYNWGGAEFHYQVEQTYTDEDEEEEDDHEINMMRAQIHILGDMAPPQNEEEQNETVLQKIETKSVVCGTTEGDIRIKIKPVGTVHHLSSNNNAG